MKLTMFSDLCLRVVLTLAQQQPQTSQQISENVGLPYNHVSKAVVALRNLGVISVSRGRTGGSSLTEEGRRATVGGLLRQLSTNDDIAACLDKDGNPACPLLGQCGLRGLFAMAREQFYRALDPIVVADLAAPSKGGGAAVSLGLPAFPDPLPEAGPEADEDRISPCGAQAAEQG